LKLTQLVSLFACIDKNCKQNSCDVIWDNCYHLMRVAINKFHKCEVPNLSLVCNK
jgi:aminoglycoside phosphotransferase family enzyme